VSSCSGGRASVRERSPVPCSMPRVRRQSRQAWAMTIWVRMFVPLLLVEPIGDGTATGAGQFGQAKGHTQAAMLAPRSVQGASASAGAAGYLCETSVGGQPRREPERGKAAASVADELGAEDGTHARRIHHDLHLRTGAETISYTSASWSSAGPTQTLRP
jgi:hypothetical protein